MNSGFNMRFSPLGWKESINANKGGLQVGNDANGKPIYFMWGTRVTRATVRTDVGDTVGLGSVYFSSTRIYVKIADAGASTDWQKITTSAAD